MQFSGSAVLNLPKAIFEVFFAKAQPQQPVFVPISEERLAELQSKVVVSMATEPSSEFLPANARPVESMWEDSPECALKSLRRKAAEIRCEAVYNVIQESRPYYEGGRFFTIYRDCGVM